MHDAGKPTALRPGGSKRLESDDLLVTGELMRSAYGVGTFQQSDRFLANSNLLRQRNNGRAKNRRISGRREIARITTLNPDRSRS
jgi:hypothetical protein